MMELAQTGRTDIALLLCREARLETTGNILMMMESCL
jgi:hypothetical protein